MGNLGIGPAKKRTQFGDRALGDNECGRDRQDPSKYAGTDWQKSNRVSAADDPAAPSARERAAGERDLTQRRGGGY